MSIDLQKYDEFVDAVTSPVSKDLEMWTKRLQELENMGINISQLMTASTAMSGEAGEFSELVKKMSWHGKQLTPELHTHLVKELGDVIFYWVMACQSLNVDASDVISRNVAKLEARYPGGKFSVERSENRAEGDI